MLRGEPEPSLDSRSTEQRRHTWKEITQIGGEEEEVEVVEEKEKEEMEVVEEEEKKKKEEDTRVDLLGFCPGLCLSWSTVTMETV